VGCGIDLLLIANEKDPEKTYYVWIKDLAEQRLGFSYCQHALI